VPTVCPSRHIHTQTCTDGRRQVHKMQYGTKHGALNAANNVQMLDVKVHNFYYISETNTKDSKAHKGFNKLHHICPNVRNTRLGVAFCSVPLRFGICSNVGLGSRRFYMGGTLLKKEALPTYAKRQVSPLGRPPLHFFQRILLVLFRRFCSRGFMG